MTKRYPYSKAQLFRLYNEGKFLTKEERIKAIQYKYDLIRRQKKQKAKNKKPVRKKIKKSSKYKSYKAYLRSKQWSNKRQRIFKQRGKACERCGETKYLHIHHLTYENVFNEKDIDLLILCKECHMKEHKK